MRDNKGINWFAGLTTIGALAFLFLCAHDFAPRVDPDPHEASGWAAARHALARLKTGGQIIVITRDTTVSENPASDLQLASFKKTLRKARVDIAAVQSLQIDPLRPVEVPAGDFFELIRRTPSGSVIVSFMGPPLLTQAQRTQLGDIKPAIVAFCPGTMPDLVDLRSLLDQHLLQVAIIVRREVTGAPPRKDLQGVFDRYFVALTNAPKGVVTTASFAPQPAQP